MSGYIKLHRGWRENGVFGNEFSRADAWVWLIENAAWKPSRARIKSTMVSLDRGELSFSQRFLAEKWGWSKSRVDRFIAELRAEGMIETRSKNGATSGHNAGQGQSILRLCNYDKYQEVEEFDRGNVEPESGATSGQRRGKEEERKEGKKEEKNKSARARVVVSKPDSVPEQAWADFLSLRRAKRAPLTVTAFATIEREAEKASWPLSEVIAECVSRGWQSFKAEWVTSGRRFSTAYPPGHSGVPV